MTIEIDNYKKDIEKMAKNIKEMPTTRDMSSKAREIFFKYYNEDEVFNNPDKTLELWLKIEYDLFKCIEKKLIKKVVKTLKVSDDDFVDNYINSAMSVINRRKSRAGKSLENQIEAMIRLYKIPYSSQCITENKKRPDFIFPSIINYHDENNTRELIFLACKTTLKDRWVQILTEAKKIPVKYLLTTQEVISLESLDTMREDNVIIVSPYAKNYNDVPNIISVEDFMKILISTYK